MSKKILWAVVSGVMALSLVLAACAPAAPPTTPPPTTAPPTTAPPTTAPPTTTPPTTTPTEEKPQQEAVKPSDAAPKYGGTVFLSLTADLTQFDGLGPSFTPSPSFRITNEPMWGGDWTKGPAGGFGTNESDWLSNYDVFDHKAGYAAESWKWSIDDANNSATLVYQVRQDTHYYLQPEREASRLVGGREMTADDVVFSLDALVHDKRTYVYRANPELRASVITKTGPSEVSIDLPLNALISAISRMGNYGRVMPPEVINKYGNMADWKNVVGTGPFMIKDSVPGSTLILEKNPNYWGKDPIGPGKGNQVPYIDRIQYLIIPDLSTRQAALRTGKIDQLTFNWEDADQIRKTAPKLLEKQAGEGGGGVQLRVDMPPFDDVRVRRALMMATDFELIRNTVRGGLGHILTYPWAYSQPYKPLLVDFADPDITPLIKEIYTYNPEGAKKLLAEAGYPNGFKVTALAVSTEVDYPYSIWKDMWAKVGIDLDIDVRESGQKSAIINNKEHPPIASSGGNVVGIFYLLPTLVGTAGGNAHVVDDPFINDKIIQVRRAVITTGLGEAMNLARDITKHSLEQAYGVPTIGSATFNFWWPWLKNYDGELTVGYFNGDWWTIWGWVDQDLKKSMGF